MFKRTQVCVGVLVVLGGAASPSMAQTTLERVEITGSSIKRIDAETSVPVTVVTRASIERSGASNVQELVDRMSANNGGGRSLGESVGDSAATGQSGASMRGLGRERTLILLNGRRLAVYPFAGQGVDLNAIPVSAIERIEIVRDGASAIYGSDAIGGVMNFITRKDFQGGDISVGYERPSDKGGSVKNVQGGFGVGDLAKNGFNLLASLSYQEYEVVRAMDRAFAQTGNRPDIGVVKTSGNTFPANAWTNDLGTFVAGAPGYPACAPPDSFNDGTTGNCRYDYTHYVDLIPASKRLAGLARATVQLNSDNVLFGEFMHTKNKLTFGSSQTPSVTTGRPGYLYPGGGKYYPTAAVDAVQPGYRGDLAISWRMVDGGQRLTEVTNEMNRFLVGAEGSIAGVFDYKVGLMKAEAKAKEDFVSGNFSDTRLVQVLATGNVNPWGPNDQTGLDLLNSAQLSGNNRTSKTVTDSFDVLLTREMFALSGGAAALAVGMDLRKETYLDGYSDIAGSGDIVGGSGNAGKVEGSRNTSGFFAEMNFPVLKSLELNAAVRTDRYTKTRGESRDGTFSAPDMSATSPKLSLKWTPSKAVMLRGSVGKGFRAPALDNMFAPSAGTNTGGNFTDPFYDALVGCANISNTNYCNTQLTAVNNSNPALKAEKSKTLALGIILEPVTDLSLGLDYFDIKITDAIKALTGDDILVDWFRNRTGPTTSSSAYSNRLILNAQGYLDYVNASLENVGKLQASGFDLSAKYRIRTAAGSFTPSWDATILTKSIDSNVVTGEEKDTLGKYARGGPAVRFKQNITLDWDSAAWGATLNYYRQSGYEDYDEVRQVKSYDLWNLQGQFKGVKNLVLTVGVRNLLDKKPPVTVQEDYFQVAFDPTYADVKGRTFYVRAGYRF